MNIRTDNNGLRSFAIAVVIRLVITLALDLILRSAITSMVAEQDDEKRGVNRYRSNDIDRSGMTSVLLDEV